MDPHPAPFPVKPRVRKLNPMGKISEPPKISAKGGPRIFREKQVFGTIRNPNIPLKPALQIRVKAKPSSGLLRKAAKPPPSETKSTTLVSPISGDEKKDATRKLNKTVSFREKQVFGTIRNPNLHLKQALEIRVKAKPSSGLLRKAVKPPPSETKSMTPVLPISGDEKKDATRKLNKTVSFQATKVDRIKKSPYDGSSIEHKTPVRSTAVLTKPRLATPFLSAEKCSKCRFDKFETSSYWLGQIKSAESVGKHFVSSAFFGLAIDCKAEPVGNIRVELKKYVGRHSYLNDEEVWKNLFVSYGLVDGENSIMMENTKENVEENPEETRESIFHGCSSSKHSEKSSPGRQLFS